MAKPIPKNQERNFGMEEMFFSRTDAKGLIEAGNDVFVRISGYSREELIGAPHNVIRHPDMPKCVFRLFWEMLKAGRPIAAYVKNMANDGTYYWVMAIAIPVQTGYVSVRIKPSSALFARAQELYRAALAAEKNGGMDEGAAVLMKGLQDSGFSDYEAFMTEALCVELKARDQFLGAQTGAGEDGEAGFDPLQTATKKIAAAAERGAAVYQQIFLRLDDFKHASEVFRAESSTLLSEFRDLRHLSTNMTISAARFGREAETLSVVSTRFQALTEEIERHLKSFLQASEEIRRSLGRSSLNIAALKSQVDMVAYFVRESLHKTANGSASIAEAFTDVAENQPAFQELSARSLVELQGALQQLNASVRGFSKSIEEISTFVNGLALIRLVGNVESSRTEGLRSGFGNQLNSMREFTLKLREAAGRLADSKEALFTAISFVQENSPAGPETLQQIFGLLAALRERDQGSRAA